MCVRVVFILNKHMFACSLKKSAETEREENRIHNILKGYGLNQYETGLYRRLNLLPLSVCAKAGVERAMETLCASSTLPAINRWTVATT